VRRNQNATIYILGLSYDGSWMFFDIMINSQLAFLSFLTSFPYYFINTIDIDSLDGLINPL